MAARTPARVRVATSLEQQVEVETPEQIALSFTIAGLGSRAAAALVDTAICAGLYGVLLLAVRIAAGGSALAASTPWAVTLLVLGQFAIVWGYYVLWEGLRDGQTPGKRRFGLRVVRDGGYAIDFPASAARNLVRAIDLQPGVIYGVGLVSAAASKQSKRLGDHVAGTIVVRERALPLTLAVPMPAAGARPLTTLLRDDEYEVLARLRERGRSMEPARLAQLTVQLAARLRPRAESLAAESRTDAAFLARLHEHERMARAQGVAALRETGARREHYAIIAEGMPRWQAFAERLRDAQERGLAALGEEGVSDFVARYRELTTDLARLRTATRDRDVAAVYHVSRLVAAGHNLLYRGRRMQASAIPRYLFGTVPREIRRAWRPILLASALLYLPAVTAFVAVVRSDTAATALVPRGLIDRAETGVVREQQGGGYLPEDDAKLRGPVLASLIATNNVQITYVTFASGVTAGLLTIFLLVSNGVAAIGAPLGYYARLGILPQILGFVVGHGVLELTAICIAGGAAFELAAGLLLPGALTRQEAIVMRGRRALHLMAGTTLLLLVAGLIEGFVSPLVWPLPWKLALSAATAVALLAYLNAGRGPRPGARR